MLGAEKHIAETATEKASGASITSLAHPGVTHPPNATATATAVGLQASAKPAADDAASSNGVGTPTKASASQARPAWATATSKPRRNPTTPVITL